MSEPIVPVVPSEGNTKSSDVKQISPAKRWCFTLNNWTEEEYSSIVPIFDATCKFVIIGSEVGDGGTPHLQGYCEFKSKRRPKTLMCNRIHWEKAIGNKMQNIKYCEKEGDVLYTKGMPPPVKIIDKLYPWQKVIEAQLLSPPDDRSINWYWEEHGNMGKTQLMKYFCVKHKCLPCVGGKFADIMNLVFNCDLDETPGIIFNIPRAHNEKVSYSSLEAIKDGIVVNTKYETGFKCFNSPHVIVFANFPPDLSTQSADRWKVHNLVELKSRLFFKECLSEITARGPDLPVWAGSRLKSTRYYRFLFGGAISTPMF